MFRVILCILFYRLTQLIFFNITKYKYVKEIHFYVIFLTKKFVLSMTIRIFTARELAKPLNDAQMCGSFFVFIGRWQQKFRL